VDIPKLNTRDEAESFIANVFTPITDILVEWEKDRRKHPWVHLRKDNGWQFFINKELEYTALLDPADRSMYAIGISIKEGKIKRSDCFYSRSITFEDHYSPKCRMPQVIYEEQNLILVDNYEDGLYSKIGIYSVRFVNEMYILYEDGSRLLWCKETEDLNALKTIIRERIRAAMEYKNIKKTVRTW
jgi:hypothetical protein